MAADPPAHKNCFAGTMFSPTNRERTMLILITLDEPAKIDEKMDLNTIGDGLRFSGDEIPSLSVLVPHPDNTPDHQVVLISLMPVADDTMQFFRDVADKYMCGIILTPGDDVVEIIKIASMHHIECTQAVNQPVNVVNMTFYDVDEGRDFVAGLLQSPWWSRSLVSAHPGPSPVVEQGTDISNN